MSHFYVNLNLILDNAFSMGLTILLNTRNPLNIDRTAFIQSSSFKLSEVYQFLDSDVGDVYENCLNNTLK